MRVQSGILYRLYSADQLPADVAIPDFDVFRMGQVARFGSFTHWKAAAIEGGLIIWCCPHDIKAQASQHAQEIFAAFVFFGNEDFVFAGSRNYIRGELVESRLHIGERWQRGRIMGIASHAGYNVICLGNQVCV